MLSLVEFWAELLSTQPRYDPHVARRSLLAHYLWIFTATTALSSNKKSPANFQQTLSNQYKHRWLNYQRDKKKMQKQTEFLH